MSTECIPCPFLKGNDVFQCHPRSLIAAREKVGFKPEETMALKALICDDGDYATRKVSCPAFSDFELIGKASIFARRTTNNH